MSKWLLVGGVVSGLGINVERRQTLGRGQLNLDFSPSAIVPGVARFVSQDILIAQLQSNLGGDIRQFIQTRHREDASAGKLCDF